MRYSTLSYACSFTKKFRGLLCHSLARRDFLHDRQFLSFPITGKEVLSMPLAIYSGVACQICRTVAFAYSYEWQKDMMWFICVNHHVYYYMANASRIIPRESFERILWEFSDKDYSTHCWHCKSVIIAKAFQATPRDPIPTLGYQCQNCGQTLRGYIAKNGLHIISRPPIQLF